MSKAKRTFLSAVWNHTGRTAEYVVMYVTSVLIARGLGVEENGRFVGLFSLTQLLLVACSLGLETSLNKFIPQLREADSEPHVRTILRRVLLLRLAAFAATVAACVAVMETVSLPFLDTNRHVLARVLAFTGLRSIVPLFAMVLTARLQTSLTASITFAVRLLELGGVFLLFTFGFTVENLFLVFFCTSAAHVAGYMLFSRSSLFGAAKLVDLRPIFTFGGVFWMNTLVDFILGRQGDVLLLANIHPHRAQAGLYDVAYSLAQLASMAMTVGLSGVSFATFARLAVTEQGVMDRFYAFSIRIISLLTIPLYAFLIAHAEGVLRLLYSPNYNAAASLLVGILLFRLLSRLFGGPENAEYVLSRGKVGMVVGVGMVAATINLVLNLLLIPTMGAAGSVIAGGCANVTVNALGAMAVFSMSPNKIQFRFWLKLSLLSLVAAFAVRAALPGESPTVLVLNASIYFAFLLLGLFFIKPLTEADADWLARIGGGVQRVVVWFTPPKSNIVETKAPAL